MKGQHWYRTLWVAVGKAQRATAHSNRRNAVGKLTGKMVCHFPTVRKPCCKDAVWVQGDKRGEVIEYRLYKGHVIDAFLIGGATTIISCMPKVLIASRISYHKAKSSTLLVELR
jgi:hypothetical protein